MATAKNRTDLTNQSSDTFQDAPPANITPENHRIFNDDFILSAASILDKNEFLHQQVFAPRIALDIVDVPVADSVVFIDSPSNSFIINIPSAGFKIKALYGKEGMWFNFSVSDDCSINAAAISLASGALMLKSGDIITGYFVTDTEIVITAEKRGTNSLFYVDSKFTFQDIKDNNALIPGFTYYVINGTTLDIIGGGSALIVLATSGNSFSNYNVMAVLNNSICNGVTDLNLENFKCTTSIGFVEGVPFPGLIVNSPTFSMDTATSVIGTNANAPLYGNSPIKIEFDSINAFGKRNVKNYLGGIGGPLVGSLYTDPLNGENYSWVSDEGTNQAYGAYKGPLMADFAPSVGSGNIEALEENSGYITFCDQFYATYMVVNDMVHLNIIIGAGFANVSNELAVFFPLPFIVNTNITFNCEGPASFDHSPNYIAGKTALAGNSLGLIICKHNQALTTVCRGSLMYKRL